MASLKKRSKSSTPRAATESDVAVEHLGELRGRQWCLATQLAARSSRTSAPLKPWRERPTDLLFDPRQLPLFESQVAALTQLHREGRDQSSTARLERQRLEVLVLAVLRDDGQCHR